jgi:hypothetical protein
MATTFLTGPATPTNRTSGISSANVQNTKAYLGSAIDNATNLDDFAHLEIVWSFGTNPTVNNFLKIHLLYAKDGSNYEEGAGDGSTITAPLPGCQHAAVSPPADTNTHRKLFSYIPLAPYPFKVLVENNATGQTATVTVNIATGKYQTVG